MNVQSLILGEIYDPDTDCYYVLHRVKAEDWDKFKNKTDKRKLKEIETEFGSSSRYKK